VNRYVLDGLVAVSNQSMAHLAIAQAIALISFGLWLVPRTIPQAGSCWAGRPTPT
jgi:hypothetical protein